MKPETKVRQCHWHIIHETPKAYRVLVSALDATGIWVPKSAVIIDTIAGRPSSVKAVAVWLVAKTHLWKHTYGTSLPLNELVLDSTL
jgi:hypothetical protein